MPKLLSLSRAARLAGVSRGELQKKVRKECVKTFEGKITVDVLVSLYPHIDMERDPVLERVQLIKQEARPKAHYSDGWMPDPQVLMSRLKEFQHTLVQTKSSLNASENLLSETSSDLQSALNAPDEKLRAEVERCIQKLSGAMDRLGRASDAKAALYAKDAMLKIVSASVRLLPSGHEFFLEGNDSILEAGLKAGLYLDYGCTSGNCGACKCKVVSGAVRKLRNHDYVLSAKEQGEGYVLACANTAISDLVVEVGEAGVAETLPHQEIRAQVKKVELLGESLALIYVQTPRTQSLRFKAGQSVSVTSEDGRSADLYIASCPCDGRNLQFILFREDDVGFGDAVFDATLARQTVLLEGPMGGFVLQEDSTAPALFLAKEGGFSPVKSLVEQAITIDNAEGLNLVHIGGNPAGSSLDNLCRSWNDSLDNFHYTSTAADISADELAQLLLNANTDSERVEVYIAGPAAWLEKIMDAASRKGLDTGGWYTETTDR
ncbi:MAG: CDP-6-deoxy-L-threo-D-glycero-4-hexulose-3-dehydrase reductase [Gammaproteobacteria bacterium (ex Lamellibrachia satsuma)]|nr:MAG: 2Fe-2S iron-sulfur cluster binding domain-containing protein [Gammaproteobacteria bacterium (ex Lamellibrachia satsuma)]RRS30338.1 MAG: CDP-6-deoxy-L-threo-D-glycero-4-hexulose-3-dehydrase reductase [Gammaproteobacteria bacterium (ex Lamellibrachia satsuma)]RRS37331.1 MAG: CDP-6-deoxy-L-threo-D-glycero-4-hexulose-3-dehydrase reductase [Gammaproteobacteria bacterium (ex Lamellibrachia satsuma)]